MIPVNRLIDRASNALRLKTYPEVTPPDVLACLVETLMDLQMTTVSIISQETLTTVQEQSEYTLPEKVAKIAKVIWPETWTNRVAYVTPDFIEGLRRDFRNGMERLYSQPEYYSFWQQPDGKHVLALESAESIEGDLEIQVGYHPVTVEEITAGSSLDVPMSQFACLRYGLCFKLAEQFIPERKREFHDGYEEEKRKWVRSLILPSNQAIQRPVHPF